MACSQQRAHTRVRIDKETNYRQLLAPSKKWALNFVLNTVFPHMTWPQLALGHGIESNMPMVGSGAQGLALFFDRSTHSKKQSSDIDYMLAASHIIVNQDSRRTFVDRHVVHGYSDTTHTHPGYLRILVSRHKNAVSYRIRRDGSRRYLLSSVLISPTIHSDNYNCFSSDSLHPVDIHGPAMRYTHMKEGNNWNWSDKDYVQAIKCPKWPAAEWPKRKRPFGWPSKALVSKIVSDGCHIVSKAHPTSSDTDAEIEFRYSFSIAEVEICQELCEVQKHCFIVYKLALGTAAEVNNVSPECQLSSYHLKTVFWWLCEQKSPRDWTSDALGERLVDLLNCLLKCLREANIPNYFIPENNMISHMSESDLRMLLKLVEDVRSDPVIYLLCCPNSEIHPYPPQVLFQPFMDVLEFKDRVTRLETCVLTLQYAARFKIQDGALSGWGVIKMFMGKQSILLKLLGHEMSQSLLMSVLFIDSLKDLAFLRCCTRTERQFCLRFLAYTSDFLIAQKQFVTVIPLLHAADEIFQMMTENEMNEEFAQTRKILSHSLVISYMQLDKKTEAKKVVCSHYGFPRKGKYSKEKPMSEEAKELNVQQCVNPGEYYF